MFKDHPPIIRIISTTIISIILLFFAGIAIYIQEYPMGIISPLIAVGTFLVTLRTLFWPVRITQTGIVMNSLFSNYEIPWDDIKSYEIWANMLIIKNNDNDAYTSELHDRKGFQNAIQTAPKQITQVFENTKKKYK